MDEIVALSDKLERSGKGQVGSSAGVEIECENGGGVGDDGFKLDGVDKGLGESGSLQRGVVEAVDVIPDYVSLSVRASCHWKLGHSQPIFSSLYSPSSIPAK